MASNRVLAFSVVLSCLLTFLSIIIPVSSRAENSICAKVKIEIRQEVTFERQAFDAHMQINNGLTTISLENINVDVLFSDKDGNPVRASSNPDDPDALFFIRISSQEGIDNVTGDGSIAPATTADIHWLIIPAPDSVKDSAIDILYYVGAKLTYTLGGEEQVTSVTPDYIKVRPLPLLTLDYFLPDEVYGDDPFTAEVEPSILFSLGVRITNNGQGTANDLKIDSAQPKITDNEQGLAVDFLIEGSEVNGVIAPDTLLIKFGDIEPHSTAIGRWLMSCSLSGRFVEFDAEFSHANELGGNLTSLLEDVKTHFLVRDVFVDLPGRDEIRDFLGKDVDIYRVYESDAGITEVADVSSGSELTVITNSGNTVVYALSTIPTAGFSYLRLDDPQIGTKLLSEVIRSDGKVISPHNAWLSKKRIDSTWTHYLNLFDSNGTSSYTLKFIDPSLAPQSPVFTNDTIPAEKEGEELTFLIQLSDPDTPQQSLMMMRTASTATAQTTPTGNLKILSGTLPVGAEFIDLGNGTGTLRWTPQEGQSGDYPLTFTATDGELTTTIRYHLIITDDANIPTAQFSGMPTTGLLPLQVLFVDESLSIDGISELFWDFGDGASSDEETPFHTYDKAGIYTVSLTVTEIDGDRHTISYPDYITVNKEEDVLPIEYGTLSVDHTWQLVPLSKLFIDPVIVATVTGAADDSEPATVRISEVTPDGFTIRLEEGLYGDGAHPLEEVSYIVIERGTYTLENGKQIIAGHLETSDDGSFVSSIFTTPPATIPVVVASLTSTRDPAPANTIVKNVGETGFQVKLQPEKARRGAHGSERVDFIAWEPSTGLAGSIMFDIGLMTGVKDSWQSFDFTHTFNIPPVVAAGSQSNEGRISGEVLGRNRLASGIDFRITGGNRNRHVSATVGYIALSLVTVEMDTDGDGLNDLEELTVYGTSPRLIDTDGDGIDDYQEVIFWGENWIADHDNDGVINLLDFDADNDGAGDGLEKQYGFDPADPDSHPDKPIIEYGTLSVDHTWQLVPFSEPFIDPVIVATVTGAADNSEPAAIRISEITHNGFIIRLEEGLYADGAHPLEEISYIVLERGTYTLANGKQIIAGHLQSSDDGSFVNQTFPTPLATIPVVMASLAGISDTDPANTVINNVTKTGFKVKLQPEEAVKKNHGSERIDFIAWEPSTGLAGSIMFDIGLMAPVNGNWNSFSFNHAFNIPPVVTAIRQTLNGNNPATVLGRNPLVSGIDFRIAEDTSADLETKHANETVGFIALSPVTTKMDTDGDGLNDLEELTVYGSDPRLADTDGDGIDDYQEVIFWGENWIADHDNDGVINLLDFDADNDGAGDGLEKQYGFDPADPDSHPDKPIIEYGTLSVDHTWQLVPFSEPFIDPVIVATVTGAADNSEPAAVRISEVTHNGFTIRLEEGLYADGAHPLEEISYIVLERGRYTLTNGKQIIADHLLSSDDGSFVTQTFPTPLATIPVVMASLAGISDTDPANTVVNNVTKTGFKVKLQPEEAVKKNHGSERIDFIAWEPSTGLAGSIKFDIGLVTKVNGNWKSFTFNNAFNTPPVVAAIRQTFNGSNPATVLARNRLASEIDFRIAEDTSADLETTHANETVGFIALGQ